REAKIEYKLRSPHLLNPLGLQFFNNNIACLAF
ncbi:MAG: hypothetical protein ACJAYM_002721, partial [Flavobacteriales bacterium]